MTLVKALEIGKSLLDGTYDHRDEEMEAGLKLLIEAGKRIQEQRRYRFAHLNRPLPNETPE